MKKSKPVLFIEWVNKKFVPSNPKYPVGIIRTDGQCLISGECYAIDPQFPDIAGCPVVDYYGEFRGGYSWIHEVIEAEAAKRGLTLEWENPGCVGVYE
jgi:hypothetical protein